MLCNGWHDLTNEEYHAGEGLSSSALKVILRSAAHYNCPRVDRPKSKALTLGTAVHTAVLEPDEYVRNYRTTQQCSECTVKGTQCTNTGVTMAGGEWYCGVHNKRLQSDDGITALTEKESEMCAGISRSVLKHASDIIHPLRH